MMYNSKLAVAIKNNGKVLREFGENVYLPFGSEYSVLIKNLNSVRALATITIDGVDVGDGHRFVIEPNSSLDVERFIKNNNLQQGNRFKFIERTQDIENHRGISIDDGLIQVQFAFEDVQTKILLDDLIKRSSDPGPWMTPPYEPAPWQPLQPYYIGTNTGDSPLRSIDVTCSTSCEVSQQSDTGITVPGSVSNQQFDHTDNITTLSETHTIVLKLLGETQDNKQITEPVTVKTKPKCITCGRTNKATAKFCSNCGTSLTIV